MIEGIDKFNVRVYGILVHEDKIMYSEEEILGDWVTKFPGGGVELGEGLHEALKREFIEELNIEIEVGELFFVNDFCQPSFYKPSQQLVCVYYYVSLCNKDDIDKLYTGLDIDYLVDYKLHWRNITNIISNEFTFPIDQAVACKLSLNKN